MKRENKPNGTAPETSQTKVEKKIESVDLPQKVEHQVAQVIKLQWAMLRSLQSIDASTNILAAQKKRELDAEQSESEKAQ
jgi:esterase/lipase